MWVAWWCASVVVRGEEGSEWRSFRAADGLRESFSVAVTVSPRGNVWVRHRESEWMSELDGYRVRTFPSASPRLYPVYEGRSGQVWTVYPEGLADFQRGRWTYHPVPLVELETKSNPLRTVRAIPIVPTEFNHVLALLPDRLIEFDAGSGEVRTLRVVGETSIGKFIDLVEARDGGGWITGERGVARLPRPLRRLDASTVWTEWPLPAGWTVRNLDRPSEDVRGGVTVVADDVEGERRVVLGLEGGDWERWEVAGERVRQAWRGPEGRLWAMTRNSLLHQAGETFEVVAREGILAGQFYDVAVETNGVFWLATSEGLLRHSPSLWSVPDGWTNRNMLVHAVAEAKDGALWFAGGSGLIRRWGEVWSMYPWPENVEAAFEPSSVIEPLPDGRIAVGSASGVLLFDPVRRVYEALRPVAGGSGAALVGRVAAGGGVVFSVGTGIEDARRLDVFDGWRYEPLLRAGVDWGPGASLNFVRETTSGELWIGGSQGLAVWRRGGLEAMSEEAGFSAQRALCLEEVEGGRLWCGSGDVLFEYDGKRWTTLRFGLERVNAIRRTRGGQTWVATSSGLYRVNQGAWLLHSVEEGLASDVVYQVYEDGAGRLWAGSTRGLNVYRPEADLDAPRTFEALRQWRAEVPTDEPVRFVLSGLDKWKHTPSNRLLFSWRLDEGMWSVFAPLSFVEVAPATAGRHRLEVQAMDLNGNIELKPVVHEFTAVLPWYQEPRLVGGGVAAVCVTLLLGWLAVNRHLRLVRSYAEVERIVSERTQQLERANQQLLHSQKMKALGTLAAGVAHDFNNILSIIKGSAQIIESNVEDPEKIRSRVGRIKTVVDQGATLVKAMLGLSRVSIEGQEGCDLNEAVEETVRLLGDRFLAEVQLELVLADADLRVTGTADIVQQMLLNLIINAADAMGGRGTVRLRTGIRADAPAQCVLAPAAGAAYGWVSVEDEGTGIDPEVLPRIFEPFFTTKSMSSRRGTGLGLSMVYELARELGYGLLVESRVGVGSAFTLLLPRLGTGGEGEGNSGREQRAR